mmetsp:Transcript_28619/g.45253  ORF Transcript_28619/g.45253 Transcript_28619/m.45253 type:complete len:202 (+) Transcript_28619:41-646(+)|eukprot:CAMPEP_0197036014 /NCGR_PEP_ID=MMETSP1384-20130603/13642_1 /TAXON_ID=29189 /ORGANISM="Ammonia sp." /LENGTH=201 /DNA_ID=CAMNT_0042466139 /DNA_START=34 /DNA_END=639 /DNA_ORIENTATION=+
MAQPAAKEQDLDTLKLANDAAIQKLLETEGLGAKEKIVMSTKITKINRKGKKQDRYLMITQKAVYNLKPKKYQKSKRRVLISDVGMITLSAVSPEFAIHVPNEYDYHFLSKNKDHIANVLKQLYEQQTEEKLLVVYSEMKHLKDLILTKKLAKFENHNSKNAMKENITSTKDVLAEIDDDKDEETESEDGDILTPDDDDDD